MTRASLPVDSSDLGKSLYPSTAHLLSKAEFQARVFVWRTLFLAALSLCYCLTQLLDEAVASVWRYLLAQWWFRHDSFEPVLAVTSFVVWIKLWHYVDAQYLALPYRINGTTNTFQSSFHKLSPGVHSIDKPTRRNDSYEALGVKVILLYLLPLFVIDYLVPRRAARLPSYPPHFWTILMQVVAMLVVYDTSFFVGHLLLHKIPFLYRTLHATHHNQVYTRAMDTVRVTFLEQVLLVGCSVFAVNVTGSHPLSHMVYNIVITYLLTELHAGYDMPWMLQNVVPLGLWGGSRRHEWHHRCGRVYFQKFGTFWDDLLGFTLASEKEHGLLSYRDPDIRSHGKPEEKH